MVLKSDLYVITGEEFSRLRDLDKITTPSQSISMWGDTIEHYSMQDLRFSLFPKTSLPSSYGIPVLNKPFKYWYFLEVRRNSDIYLESEDIPEHIKTNIIDKLHFTRPYKKYDLGDEIKILEGILK